ncbi:WGR domain-containing protein, partial [Bradyrhizobium sp. Mp64]
MPNLKLGPLHLRRIDTTRNMRRFYLLSIQPTLFGGVSIARRSGSEERGDQDGESVSRR